ncbi:NAD(P)H-quinone oxidoreductase [Paenalcaligenes suwonensis]|uniref:NAD(P)H-quinone oxidoreductase n=1 Tax=Paenalcaligenes suwonensis TaxID=1202713 RepID=UPI00140CFDA1|nr:NAD(P)H-quinone oxidoreductase [Paenalcaligenes suwonensis]NHC62752.1 NAD(P)H-quinone oxidoreductase [Paenalcaligenes suwonensis]
MKAIEISQPGGPDVLNWVDRPMPEPAAGQLLLRVIAAGVNRPDVMQRKGMYPAPPGASDIPGLEVSGEIVGGDVSASAYAMGDKVCALLSGGGYAQYCVVDAEHCLPIPAGMDPVHAAGIPETAFTVWSNIFNRGALAKGESLLVHGGASGIGTMAIQLAVARGHQVFATAGSDERVAIINALGATGINYKTQIFEDVVREATGGRGVDVILDMVAGDYINRDIRCLADDGRIVVIALQGAPKGEVNFAQMMLRRLTLTGSTLRARDKAFKAALAAQVRENVWPLLESGAVQVKLHAIFDMADAAQAHAMMDAGEQVGKIILRA